MTILPSCTARAGRVELFFKWIKQHLRIKRFFGTSENAVKTQVWIAVAVYVLVAIVRKRLNLELSLHEMLQILSITPFEKIPMIQLLTYSATDQDIHDNPNQLILCFAELSRGRPVDELIQRIIEGNECIAILGIASMLALHTETVSEVTFPLFTSQRLLAADHNRMLQDLSASTANLMGFRHSSDKPHFEAVKAANERLVRRTELRWMVPAFMFESGSISDRARNAILNFKDDLPYLYEEHREISEARQYLTAQALEYAELADRKNYQAYRTKEDSDQIAIVHVSPSASRPENVARAEEASRHLRQLSLWTWASKSFEEGVIQGTFSIEDAISFAREVDSADLFVDSNSANGTRRLAYASRCCCRDRCHRAQFPRRALKRRS